MVDRSDIDALLISALYGELTPADEARLKTHLESHPADRSALDSLTEIHATFRASGIGKIQLDPPQAISALLLQEAARRAPKMVRAKDDREVGWFTRFVRSFAAHPAMAAATMLVLVAGIGGLVYLNQGSSQFADQKAADESSVAITTPTTATATASAGSAATANFALDAGIAVVAPTVPSDTDQFHADLADTEKTKDQVADKLAPKATPTPMKKPAMNGIIVGRDEPAPKELAYESVKKPPAPKATMTAKPQDQRELQDPAMVPGRGNTTSNSPETGYAGDKYGNGTSAGAGSAAPSPPPPPPQIAKTPVTAPPPAKAETALVAWAKDQHQRVAQYVRDGNCRDAAPIAAQIAARANDYYNQYVATDRALKACTAYFNDAREKDAERSNKARAQKRVDVNEVSPAPSATSR